MRDMRAGSVPSGLPDTLAPVESLSTWARGRIGRRDFLKRSAAASAGLVIAFYIPAHGEDKTGKVFQPNAWLQLEPNGKISLWVSRSEMGQGVRTSMAMLVAEELEADWPHVQIVQADADAKYGDMVTGGSASVRTSWEPLRKAGAAGREMLVTAAAQIWSAPADECYARDEAVFHRPTSRKLSYGELAEKAATLPVPKEPHLKDSKDFRIVGMKEPRVDGPRIVVGEAKYGIDTKVPGMLYAAITRCPIFGGRVKKFEATKAKAMPGVRHVVEVPAIAMPTPFGFEPGKPGNQHVLCSGVAVVAESTWQAMQGCRALELEWDDAGHAAESTESHRAQCAEMAKQKGKEYGRVGDPEAEYVSAARKIEAVYEVPFLAHTPMEPQNCTADVKDGKCTAWAPTQNAQGVLAAVARALNLPTSAITLHVTLLGGGFGRRLNVDYGVEAALLSKAVNAPVKVTWTREDDIRYDYYRPMSYHRLRAGLDANNRVVAWLHHVVAPTTDGFYEGPETPDLGGSELGGPGAINGGVPNYLIEASFLKTAVPRGYLRAVDNIANNFAVESFIDELAALTGKNHLKLRHELIGEWKPLPAPKGDEEQADIRRLRRVLDIAADKAGWGGALPARRGRGMAGLYCFGSYVGQVAEVSVAPDGKIKVDRVVLAIDCGQVVNPDMLLAQMEGGITLGLTAALYGEITIAEGRTQQSNFNNYRMLRMPDMPKVEVHIAPSGDAPGGIGELGVPSIAPAVGNAIFAATGKRLRRQPFRASELAQT